MDLDELLPLGGSFRSCVELPKLYLECGHCDAPSLSIIKLLTGLRRVAAGGAPYRA